MPIPDEHQELAAAMAAAEGWPATEKVLRAAPRTVTDPTLAAIADAVPEVTRQPGIGRTIAAVLLLSRDRPEQALSVAAEAAASSTQFQRRARIINLTTMSAAGGPGLAAAVQPLIDAFASSPGDGG